MVRKLTHAINDDETHSVLLRGALQTQWNLPPKSTYKSSFIVSMIVPTTTRPCGLPIEMNFDRRSRLAKLTGLSSLVLLDCAFSLADFSTLSNIRIAFLRPLSGAEDEVCAGNVEVRASVLSLCRELSSDSKLECLLSLSPDSFIEENSATLNDRKFDHFIRNIVQNLLLIIAMFTFANE